MVGDIHFVLLDANVLVGGHVAIMDRDRFSTWRHKHSRIGVCIDNWMNTGQLIWRRKAGELLT